MAATDMESDDRFERRLGNLLRVGVLASASVVLLGGAVYLVRHAGEPAEGKYRVFTDDPSPLRSPGGIIAAALDFRGRGIVQLGMLMLIATPVARVVFSVAGFARQRDFTY